MFTYRLEHIVVYQVYQIFKGIPESKVHGANMGPIWGRQDPGGPHFAPMNFAVWDCLTSDEMELFKFDKSFQGMIFIIHLYD